MTKSGLPTASVIVCAYTWERWDAVKAALAAVSRQTVPPFETILVIDKNPTLFSEATAEFPAVLVVENLQSKGLSGARNTGVAKASGDIVAFLDDDAVPQDDWLQRLLEPYSDSHTLGVGGYVEPLWEVDRPQWFPDEFGWVVGCSYRGQPTHRQPVRNPIGANMSFRRSVVEEIGGFDERVGRIGANSSGCEETELSIRALRRHPGGAIVFEPSARVCHRVTAQRTSLRYFASRCLAEGKSKAIVAGMAGPTVALSSERVYLARTLPKGVRRELRAAATSHRTRGLLRALSIGLGALITGTGYALGRYQEHTSG